MTTGNVILSSDDLLNLGTYTINTVSGYNGSTYALDTSWTNVTTNPVVITNENHSGKISITGVNADIDMNGKSMKTWMERVEARLAILEPNKQLEAEWAELKELGERYRALEQEITEKMKTWDILKQE